MRANLLLKSSQLLNVRKLSVASNSCAAVVIFGCAGSPPDYCNSHTALTNPRSLDLPFASWTLDRLRAYLTEEKDIPIKRSRIDELLIEEGLRWRTQETRFGERVDPEFAKKRGPSTPSIPTRLRIVS